MATFSDESQNEEDASISNSSNQYDPMAFIAPNHENDQPNATFTDGSQNEEDASTSNSSNQTVQNELQISKNHIQKKKKQIHKVKNSDITFKCCNCKYSGNKKANLDNHYYQKKACALVKKNLKPFVCIEPGCKSAFKLKTSANRHSNQKGHKYARTENSNNEQRMEQN